MNVLSKIVHSRGLNAVTVLQTVALLPPFIVAISERGIGTMQIAATAVLVCLIWENIFAILRRHPISFNGATTGLIVAICVTADIPNWQIAVVASLGIVLGELIFGGRGFSFVNAAVVSLAILLLSFPAAELATLSVTISIAAIVGAFLLLAAGLLPWRIVLACLVGCTAFFLVSQSAQSAYYMLIGLVFAVAFLIADPMASSVTKSGQVIQGLLAAALLIIFKYGTADTSLEPVIQAALLASIFAPLIDWTVITTSAKLRERQYG